MKRIGELTRLGRCVRDGLPSQQRMYLEAEAGGVEFVIRFIIFSFFEAKMARPVTLPAQRCLQLRRPFSSLTETGIRKHQVLFGPRHRHIEQPVGFMSLAASDLFTNFSVIPVALLVTGRWIHPLRA